MKQKRKNRVFRAVAFGAIYASDSNEGINMAVEITDLRIRYKIISGEVRGLSPAYKIKEWECSICHGDLEECLHEIGKRYGKAKCQPIAKEIEFTEISVVDVPKDPRCRIFDLLLIREENHQRNYEWYGFKVNAEIDRFGNIQRAFDGNLIPEEAAFHFGKFFSINLVGNTSYPQMGRHT